MDYPNSVPGVGLVGGKFSNGNPLTSTPASLDPAEWANAVTEEILAVINGFGLTPVEGTNNQMYLALRNILGDYKQSVRVASTAAINLAAPGANIDGVVMVAGDRFLEKDNATAANRGIYVWNGAAVAATRALDADTGAELNSGATFAVEEGTVNADSRWQLTTDGVVTIGTTGLTFSQVNAPNVPTALQGIFRNLKANASGTAATVSITADEITLGDETGAFQTLRTWNGSITTTAAGANGLDTGAIAASTWYYAFAIAKADGTKGFLASLSATAPTMPAGYTKWARIGSFYTDATANKYPLSFTQTGRRIEWKVSAGSNVTSIRILASGSSGNPSTPTWTAVAWSAYAPPTNASIMLLVGAPSNASSGVAQAAPNNNYGAFNSITNPPPIMVQGSTGSGCTGFKPMITESANIYYASGTAASFLATSGYEDNI